MSEAAGLYPVRTAMASRLDGIPSATSGLLLTATPFLPDQVNSVPLVWVEPDRPFIDYEEVYRLNRAEYRLLLTILVNRLDEPSSQAELDSFLDPWGDFIQTLLSDEIDDDLADLISYVEVKQATRYGAYSVGGTTYLGAQLLVRIST